jgi:hypothetical protein
VNTGYFYAVDDERNELLAFPDEGSRTEWICERPTRRRIVDDDDVRAAIELYSSNRLGFVVRAGHIEQRCRKCRCTAERACEGGCAWLYPDLCTACHVAGDVVLGLERDLQEVADRMHRIRVHVHRVLRLYDAGDRVESWRLLETIAKDEEELLGSNRHVIAVAHALFNTPS